MEGLISVGTDASNAFAKAPPQVAPLYVLIDRPYRDWCRNKGQVEIPKGYELRVNHAIQGHPEAPRLWGLFIDAIIRKIIGLTPTTHEQCLYYGTFNNKHVYFLRQVDNFAVAWFIELHLKYDILIIIIIEKILGKHGWLSDQFKTEMKPIPMRIESAYLKEMELPKGCRSLQGINFSFSETASEVKNCQTNYIGTC